MHFATLDEPIFIREKTVHYEGDWERGSEGGGWLYDEELGEYTKE